MGKPSVSDWIAFLTAEKHGALSSILSFTAITVSGLALIVSVFFRVETRDMAVTTVVAVLIVWGIFALVTVLIYLRSRKAAKLINEIMRDGSYDSDDGSRIRQRWNELTNDSRSSEEPIAPTRFGTALTIATLVLSIVGTLAQRARDRH